MEVEKRRRAVEIDGLVKPRKSKVDWRKGNSHGTVNVESRSNGLFPIRFTNHLHLPSPAQLDPA